MTWTPTSPPLCLAAGVVAIGAQIINVTAALRLRRCRCDGSHPADLIDPGRDRPHARVYFSPARGQQRISENVGRVPLVVVDWRSDVVERVRALIIKAEPDAVEEAKWRRASNPDGVPTFSHSGLICTVETYKDKVKVTFARGASLADPDEVFNASLDAGTRRAIDIHHGDEVNEDAFIQLIQEAVALNQA